MGENSVFVCVRARKSVSYTNPIWALIMLLTQSVFTKTHQRATFAKWSHLLIGAATCSLMMHDSRGEFKQLALEVYGTNRCLQRHQQRILTSVWIPTGMKPYATQEKVQSERTGEWDVLLPVCRRAIVSACNPAARVKRQDGLIGLNQRGQLQKVRQSE